MRIFTFSLIVSSLFIAGFFQANAKVTQYFSTGGEENVQMISTDADGNRYLIVRFKDTLYVSNQTTPILNPEPGWNALALIKESKSEQLLWSKVIPFEEVPLFTSLQIGSNSNIYLTSGLRNQMKFAGKTWSNPFSSFAATVLLRFDANGNLVWDQFYSSDGGNAFLRAVVEDDDLYLAGHFNGDSLKWENHSLASGSGIGTGVIFRYDEMNNELWRTTLNSDTIKYLNPAFVRNNNLTFSATFSGNQLLINNQPGTGLNITGNAEHPTVASVNVNSGEYVSGWTATGGRGMWGRAGDFGQVLPHPSGGTLLSGVFMDDITIAGTTINIYNKFYGEQHMVFLDENNDVVWKRSFADSVNFIPVRADIGSDGTIYLGGNFAKRLQTSGIQETTLAEDAFVLALDESNNILGFKRTFTNFFIVASIDVNTIEAKEDGGVAVGGQFNNITHFGTDSLINHGYQDGFLWELTMGELTAIQDYDATAHFSKTTINVYNVYPNPTTDRLNVRGLSPNESYQVKVFSITGALVMDQNLSHANSIISCSDIPKGTYFLRLINDRGDMNHIAFVKL
ncbi:MAG: T9SS type A sorting domain-containing protein [Bacteroidia bacterium]